MASGQVLVGVSSQRCDLCPLQVEVRSGSCQRLRSSSRLYKRTRDDSTPESKCGGEPHANARPQIQPPRFTFRWRRALARLISDQLRAER